jgi:hypothetical protein
VVLRQQDPGDPSPHVGLVTPDPQQLRCREARERVVAGHREQALASDERPDLIAFGFGSLIVPQDRGPQDIAGGVQRHEPVHLTG